MKIVSYNIKGLHDAGKAKALWKRLFTETIDVCCIQKHKMHHLAGLTLFYRGYTLLYGGIQGSYSGTLTCIGTSLNPVVHSNHRSGRCLGVTVQTPSSTIQLFNVYAYSEHQDRTLLWQDLLQYPPFDGIICGDFLRY